MMRRASWCALVRRLVRHSANAMVARAKFSALEKNLNLRSSDHGPSCLRVTWQVESYRQTMEYFKRPGTTESENELKSRAVRDTVRGIIENVAANGLRALREYSRTFDNYEADHFRLSDAEIASAVGQVDHQTKTDIAFAQQQIRNFALAQRGSLTELEVETHPGVILGHRNIPVDSAACYVPGGRYPLIASAHMGIVTAKAAGVRRVVGLTPPVNGKPHPATIAAMVMAGVDEIFLIGGAQAFAAAVFGTEELERVDMIVGPGNAYVAEAKKQLFGKVGIDLLAGPTEVLLIADASASAEMVAADLLGQAEHGPDSAAVVITTSIGLAREIDREIARQLQSLDTADIAGAAWRDHGQIILASSAQEVVEIANELAFEHVQVLTEDLDYYQRNLDQYGALFLGEMTSVAHGDKVIGTNHTLPTRRAARYTGGLWVGKFIKTCTYQRIVSAESAVMIGEIGSRLCAMENFAGHKRQIDLRVEKFGNRPPSSWRAPAPLDGVK